MTPANVRSAYVAVPAVAETVAVPPSTPPELVAVTAAVEVVRLFPVSRIRTTGCVAKAEPTSWVPFRPGWVWIDSFAAGPACVLATFAESAVTEGAEPLVNFSL